MSIRGSKAFYAFLLLVYLPISAHSQQRYNNLRDIDVFIEQADSLANTSQRTFYLNKFLKDDTEYLEKWHFSEKGGRVILFEVNFMIDSTEFSEVYYVNRNNLVCSEEYETVNYSYFEDQLKWGGIYYYVSAEPQRVVTLGKKDVQWGVSPQKEALARFERRFSELKRHIPMLPR